MSVLYFDADTLKPIPELLQFDRSTNVAFVFVRPDGSSFTENPFDDDYAPKNGFLIGLVHQQFTPENPGINQPGRYILKSYPIPIGYEAVEILSTDYLYTTNNELPANYQYSEEQKGGFYIEEDLFNRGWGYEGDIVILVRKIATDITPQPEKPSSWAEEQVSAAITSGLVPQLLQSKYTQPTTRAEFCALAVALYENIKQEIAGRTTFNDTNDVNVEKMAYIGVVSGVGDNRFAPNDTLTREQAAVMLSRLANVLDKSFPVQTPTFSDNGNISLWAVDGVGAVQSAGIMSGVGDSRFAPRDLYTREQSILTIYRVFNYVTAIPSTSKVEPPPLAQSQSSLPEPEIRSVDQYMTLNIVMPMSTGGRYLRLHPDDDTLYEHMYIPPTSQSVEVFVYGYTVKQYPHPLNSNLQARFAKVNYNGIIGWVYDTMGALFAH